MWHRQPSRSKTLIGLTGSTVTALCFALRLMREVRFTLMSKHCVEQNDRRLFPYSGTNVAAHSRQDRGVKSLLASALWREASLACAFRQVVQRWRFERAPGIAELQETQAGGGGGVTGTARWAANEQSLPQNLMRSVRFGMKLVWQN
jgi:hypothetical protein